MKQRHSTAASAAQPRELPARATAAGADAGGAVILVTEDDEDSLRATMALLREEGFVAIPARTGTECLAQVERRCPDLVLMDLALPELNGLDAAALLRRNPRTTGVRLVALSASWLSEDRERMRDAGFDAALRKPCAPAELISTVERVLRGGL